MHSINEDYFPRVLREYLLEKTSRCRRVVSTNTNKPGGFSVWIFCKSFTKRRWLGLLGVDIDLEKAAKQIDAAEKNGEGKRRRKVTDEYWSIEKKTRRRCCRGRLLLSSSSPSLNYLQTNESEEQAADKCHRIQFNDSINQIETKWLVCFFVSALIEKQQSEHSVVFFSLTLSLSFPLSDRQRSPRSMFIELKRTLGIWLDSIRPLPLPRHRLRTNLFTTPKRRKQASRTSRFLFRSPIFFNRQRERC